MSTQMVTLICRILLAGWQVSRFEGAVFNIHLMRLQVKGKRATNVSTKYVEKKNETLCFLSFTLPNSLHLAETVSSFELLALSQCAVNRKTEAISIVCSEGNLHVN